MNSLSSSQLQTVSFKYNNQNIVLDGTENNFQEAIQKLNPQAKIHKKEDPYESDEDFSEFQDKEVEVYVWKDTSPPLDAKRTTITCNDGNVKGNELLTACRSYITNLLKTLGGNPGTINSSPGNYFARSAGRFAIFKTSLDQQQPFSPGNYTFGMSHVKTELTANERLVIIDEELKKWITEVLELQVTRWDLPYRSYTDSDDNVVIGIEDILKAIKEKVTSSSAGVARKVPDNEFGTVQLYCAFPKKFPLGREYLGILTQGALHKFLDYFNALIFGVEASRNNLVFLTGFLVLSSMKDGSYPSAEGEQKGSVFYDDLLDLFPMSVTGTGGGNFVAEKAMYIATQQLDINRSKLGNRRALGFSVFRDNPQWLKVALKSVVVVYNWLADQEIICYASEEAKGSLNCNDQRDSFFVKLHEALYEELGDCYKN